MPQRSGRRRILYAILALALIGVAGYGLWAKQRLRETGEVASILPEAIKPVAPAESGTESSPTRALTESSPTSEAQPPSAAAQREEESYERARSRISVPSGEDRELTEAKVHIRAAVDHLESTGGQWWAPWQVLKTSGESIKELVNERSRREILEIFSVSEQRAELGLQRKSVVDFLARHGYKIRGKQASDLTARELFEVLSMREIRTKEKVVSILTALKEKAAASRAGRAARIRSIGNAQLAIREKSVTFDVSWRSCAFREWPVSAESHPHGRYADDDGYRARSLT
jgi:hypothetical protein